jgi:hypothetical protein
VKHPIRVFALAVHTAQDIEPAIRYILDLVGKSSLR